MNMKTWFAVLLCVASTFSGTRAMAQASVSENESYTIYVNSSTGSDVNAGTSSAKPKKTVQAAVTLALAENAKGVGVKVVLASGVYREAVTMAAGKTSSPITIQAASTGGAIIDGANLLTSYTSAGSGIYNLPWKDTVTGCSLPSGWYTGMPPVVMANEMLFVNNVPMTQVMAASQLKAGTFYVNKTSNEVQLYPPSGTTMSTAKIEVAARQSTFTVNGGKNLVFRGLVFQHAASCMNLTGATFNSLTNALFVSDEAQWNNWSGLGISSSTDVTVENSVASHNGGAGFAGFEMVSSLWNNNETDYNNWRGAMIGLYDFAQGGAKLMHMHTATVENEYSYNNESQGLWFDTDNENITVSAAKLVGNMVGNLQLELNVGPITVQGSSFCSGAGVQLLETQNLTMKTNHFYNNGGTTFQNAQLFLAGATDGRELTNYATHASTNVVTKNVTLSGNTFTAVGANEYVFNTYLTGSDWTTFLNTLISGDNTWYDSATTSDFSITNGKLVNIAAWQKLSGLDAGSSWGLSKVASTGCAVPTPSFTDFQLTAHNAASYVASYTMTKGLLQIPLQLKSFGYGTVTLSALGLPSGVTATFSTKSLVSGNSTMTLKATSSAKSAAVPITVFAVSGGRVHTVTMTVNVRPA